LSATAACLAVIDEDRTLARLRALRSDLIDPAIATHHGRIVKSTGDGSIIEFRSVVGYDPDMHGRPRLIKSPWPNHCNISAMR
jgi:class 3 adenylate cyclase